MPVSKRKDRSRDKPKTPERNRADVAKNYAKVKALRAEMEAAVDDLLDDVDIQIITRDDGKRVISWDMSEATGAALIGIYALNGKAMTVDDIMRDALARAVKADRKLRQLKADYGKAE